MQNSSSKSFWHSNKEYISIISGLRFTPRQIDILACMLSGKSAKTIANLLYIALRTVESHTQAIMERIGRHSRDDIVNFLENSDKFLFLKEHYSYLMLQSSFKKGLRDIAKLTATEGLSCLIVSCNDENFESFFLENLKNSLGNSGIIVSIEIIEHSSFLTDLAFVNQVSHKTIIHLLSTNLFQPENIKQLTSLLNLIAQHKKNSVFVFPKIELSTCIYKAFDKFTYVNTAEQINEYFLILEILAKSFPGINLESIVSEFKEKYQQQQNVSYLLLQEVLEQTTDPKALPIPLTIKTLERIKKRPIWLTFFIFISILVVMVFKKHYWIPVFGKHFSALEISENKGHSIRSDMFFPTEAAFLNRPDLIKIINSKFKDHNSIQTVALIGQGGVGKTTLARQYAQKQNTSVMKSINAKTYDSLKSSFESIALDLATTEEDKKLLREIRDIKDSTQRNTRIIQFVKDYLKTHPGWFLIFDNVEKFSDIQEYFPQDTATWGEGKIILTTRNSHIQNNEHVNNVVAIDELNSKQKLELFTKTMTHGNSAYLQYVNGEETEKFLENIPPFPLDISLASHYLKTTNVSYKEYLENLKSYNKEFEDIQINIMKEVGKYTKTRYGIITMALKNIIDEHKDFSDLLLLVSLLDSQNIPRDLLTQYKNEPITNNFIFNLKKHSFITHESSSVAHTKLTFSIHRSTQEIIFAYFKKVFDLKNNNSLEKISEILDAYADPLLVEGDVDGIQLLIPHYEKFLSQQNVLNSKLALTLRATLACMYYYTKTSDTKEIQNILETYKMHYEQKKYHAGQTNLRNLIYLGFAMYKNEEPNKIKILSDTILKIHKKTLESKTDKAAWALCYLGRIYYICGEYTQAQELLEKSYAIYQKYCPQAYAGKARTMALLGGIYERTGDYKNAKKFLEGSYSIYREQLSGKHCEMSWFLQAFGYFKQQTGDYLQAKELLEESLVLYKKYFPNSKMRISWPSIRLGNVLVDLGNPQEAIRVIEECIIDYKKHFHAHHYEIGWALLYLGRAYMNTGDYKTGRSLLKRALKIFQKNFQSDHPGIIYALNLLGAINLLENKIDESEKCVTKTLGMLIKNRHPEMYRSLELLSEIYFKRALRASNKKDFDQEQQFKEKGLQYLNQALEILQKNFPQPSPLEEKLKKKLDEFSKTLLLTNDQQLSRSSR